jgi:hypothetical protein
VCKLWNRSLHKRADFARLYALPPRASVAAHIGWSRRKTGWCARRRQGSTSPEAGRTTDEKDVDSWL